MTNKITERKYRNWNFYHSYGLSLKIKTLIEIEI